MHTTIFLGLHQSLCPNLVKFLIWNTQYTTMIIYTDGACSGNPGPMGIGAVFYSKGKKVFAVGTTTVRVLETCAAKTGEGGSLFQAEKGWTNLFIYPPYNFRGTGCLLTNFHFPKSTLLMLVSAFAGKEFILKAYQEAINRGYRFFSYGDAMLIV